MLERRAPPTFDVLIEIQTRNRLLVREDVAAAVDGILRGNLMPVELRSRSEGGAIEVETQQPEISMIAEQQRADRHRRQRNGRRPRPERPARTPRTGGDYSPVRVYAYGVARNRLQQAARRMKLPALLTDDVGQATAIVTLKNYYRRRPRLIVDAERRGTPIYVLRANTVTQMENFLQDLFMTGPSDGRYASFGEAMSEAEEAILRVQAGEGAVDLSARPQEIRRRQHQMAQQAQLLSRSFGREPRRHVQIHREGEDVHQY